MSAFNLIQTSGETPDAKGRESSMEEILASIRRIIAQDQALFAAEDASGSVADPSQDPEPQAPAYGLRQDVEAEAPSRHSADIADREPQPAAESARAQQPLASQGTDDSVAQAFNVLVASRFAQNSDAVLALTREALRPLLEAWLDAHLPALVERLVRTEIERMTKGA